MTPTEQRIAIAEYCKWPLADDDEGIAEVTFTFDNGIVVAECDVLYDLNAMHEVERTLDDNQMLDYIRILAEDVCRCYGKYGSRIAVCTATAAQRAEAFLRTIGEWKE